MIWKKIF